jgi:hypothetical protein
MGLSWASPNGGNSQKTGNKNKNNNAAASAKTANYGSGNSNTSSSSSSSGDPRGNEGNNYTNYLTPAPKAPTPIYASPNEQGQNAPAPKNVTVTAVPSANIQETKLPTEQQSNKDDLNAWLDSLEEGFDINKEQTNKLIGANTKLINDNKDTINTNQQSSDDMFNTQEEDLSSLFFEQRNQGDQILSTNRDVDDVATDLVATDSTVDAVQSELSDQQQELLQLDASAKKLGLSLVDTQGVQVDIKRDIIENQDRMQQGQNSDFIARTALDNQVNKAVDSVGVRLDDANENFDSFTDYTNDSFNLVVDGQQILGDELEESGFKMDNIFSTVESQAERRQKELQQADNNLRASLKLNEDRTYGQDYWVDRVRELRNNPETADQASSIIQAERELLGDKAYSGDIVVDAQDQYQARENLMSILSQIGGVTSDGEPPSSYGASPAAPPEYIYEQTMNNIDQWVADGLATVDETVSGMFDENTQKVYTLENGDVLTRRITSPIITDEDGKELIRLGDDVDTLFMNDVEIGTRKGDVTSVPAEGEANHIDSRVMVGDDNNPNSPANFPAEGNGNGNGQSGNNNGQSGGETPVDPTDPVVGEDIPLPNDLTDPNGAGAYGQDGNAFTLDGVTFWKRIKDRNGRWTYTRMDSFENQGTAARRQDWGQNVQNF